MIHRLQPLILSLALLGSTACLRMEEVCDCFPKPSTSAPSRVRGGAVASVSILASSDSVEVGQVAVFNFELHPPPGKTLPYSVTVSWASSDTSVATVGNGYVLGKRVGVATISATAQGVVGTRRIIVTPVQR